MMSRVSAAHGIGRVQAALPDQRIDEVHPGAAERGARLDRTAECGLRLFRIGDAVASRNIHAAIYDGIRFAMRI